MEQYINFLGINYIRRGSMPPDPPSSSMLPMLDAHLHPREQHLQLAPPSRNPIDLPLYW